MRYEDTENSDNDLDMIIRIATIEELKGRPDVKKSKLKNLKAFGITIFNKNMMSNAGWLEEVLKNEMIVSQFDLPQIFREIKMAC